MRYLLLTAEVWARCYVQYIANKSGDPKLLECLFRSQQGIEWALYMPQWQNDEFKASVLPTMDALFKSRGWLV